MSSNNMRNSRGVIKNFVDGKRNWWFTDFGKKCVKNKYGGLYFTVMSYNILSQKLLQDHKYLYQRCNQEYLKWNYRSQNLLEEIVNHNADIICLQEVQENHYIETILPHLSQYGYAGLFKKKTGDKCDGCAILYKTSVFHLQSYSAIDFRNSSIRILDRDNIGLIVLLQPVHHSFRRKKICVATTHLLYNPHRGDVKLTQLRILLAEIEKHSLESVSDHRRVYCPIILCGDMNSEPFSPLYDFIIRRNIKFERMLSGDISGQHSSHNRGRAMPESQLSLEALGINHNTQYDNRMLNSRFGKLSLAQENYREPMGYASGHNFHGATFKEQSGSFSHSIHFVSTYEHFTKDGKREVTHITPDSICTTDYIFYSTGYMHKSKKFNKPFHVPSDSDLKHLGSYGLLYVTPAKKMPQVPNAYLSSDHLCLIAQFYCKS